MTHPVLEKLLGQIEGFPAEIPTVGRLARSLSVSPSHLRSLFKTSFDMPLAGYIRSRRLSHSLGKLFGSSLKIAGIASEYGFEHEQSYIKAFRKEFGVTPGAARKAGEIIKVKPPKQLFPRNGFSDGVLLGPDIVQIPEIRCVGKRHAMPCSYDAMIGLGVEAWGEFWHGDKGKTPRAKKPLVYIGVVEFPKKTSGESVSYTPAVCVKDFRKTPDGFAEIVIPPCLCARFRYVSECHYSDMGEKVRRIFEAARAFHGDREIKYGLPRHGIHFGRSPRPKIGAAHWKIEWYFPVCAKESAPLELPPHLRPPE